MNSITVKNAAGTETVLDITEWSNEFRAYMMAYAHGVRMQRCTANAEPAKHAETRQAMFDSMARGEMPASGGGGGPRMTVEEAAWVAYFNAKASTVKFDKEKCNGKSLDKYLDTFTRKAIWPSVAKALSPMTKEQQVKFHKETLPGLITKHRPAVVAQAEATILKDYIVAETRKRNGTKDEAFQVEIAI